jgi:ubiquinone/menaquinone biosynthesis C-methylase UbiE
MYQRLIGWAFDRFYREFAWTYDTVAAAVSQGYWPAWRRAALPYLTGSVLELGCGTGALFTTMNYVLPTPPIAIDASDAMVAITGRRLRKAGYPVRVAQAYSQHLPFADASFDTVLATFPAPYIADPATLAELLRVLRPNGSVVIVLSAVFERVGWLERAIGLAYWLTLQRPPDSAPQAELRSFLGQRLAEHGFVVDERWEAAPGGSVHLILAKPQ